MTTWGDLADDEHGGRAIRFRFPWEDTDTTAVFVRRGYYSHHDDDGAEHWVHVVDYGGEVGEQSTSFAVTTPVELDPTGQETTT